MNGGMPVWQNVEHLLALTVDTLNVANWQRSKDGGSLARAPKPIDRPGGKPKPNSGRSQADIKAELDALVPSRRR